MGKRVSSLPSRSKPQDKIDVLHGQVARQAGVADQVESGSVGADGADGQPGERLDAAEPSSLCASNKFLDVVNFTAAGQADVDGADVDRHTEKAPASERPPGARAKRGTEIVSAPRLPG